MKSLWICSLMITLTSMLQAETATIRVTVANPPAFTAVSVTMYAQPITWEEITLDSALPDESGNAVLHFGIDQPRSAEFHIGEQYARLYLEPGMDLFIRVDYNQFDSTITYTGTTAANQDYLLKELLHDFRTPQTKYSLFNDAKVYSDYIDSLQGAHHSFYASFDTLAMTSSFRDFVRMSIAYQYHYARNMFTILYDPETQQFSDRELPDWYFEDLRGVDLAADQYVNEQTYDIAVSLYLDRFVVTERSNIRKTYAEIRGALQGAVRDVHLGTYIRRYISKLAENPEIGDSLMGDYNAICSTAEYAWIMNDLYQTAKKLAPGQPVPDIRATDINGVEHSVTELRGKVVYIDIWGTWCFPCIAAMKASTELRAEMAGKDVAFLYICYHDQLSNWRSYSARYDLGSTSWYADDIQSEQIKDLIDVNGVPRYLIVDREGKIVKSQAPGPDRAKTLLLQALGNE